MTRQHSLNQWVKRIFFGADIQYIWFKACRIGGLNKSHTFVSTTIMDIFSESSSHSLLTDWISGQSAHPLQNDKNASVPLDLNLPLTKKSSQPESRILTTTPDLPSISTNEFFQINSKSELWFSVQATARRATAKICVLIIFKVVSCLNQTL